MIVKPYDIIFPNKKWTESSWTIFLWKRKFKCIFILTIEPWSNNSAFFYSQSRKIANISRFYTDNDLFISGIFLEACLSKIFPEWLEWKVQR